VRPGEPGSGRGADFSTWSLDTASGRALRSHQQAARGGQRGGKWREQPAERRALVGLPGDERAVERRKCEAGELVGAGGARVVVEGD